MDPTTLATLLAALDQQREDAERRREAREVKRQEALAAHYTSLIQTVAQLHQPGAAPAEVGEDGLPIGSVPKPKLQRMLPEEDPEAYLVMFERVALMARWPQEWWALQLAPCLTGEAPAAYRALDNTAAQEYKLIKQAILRRYNVTGETYRRRFREYRRPPATRPRVVAQQLKDQSDRWLCPMEKSGQEVAELINIEQFTSVMGAETRNWITQHRPTTLEAAIDLAEAFEDAVLPSSASTPPPPKSRIQLPSPPPPSLRPSLTPVPARAPMGHLPPKQWRPRLAPSWGITGGSSHPLAQGQRDRSAPLASSSPVCWRCHEPGHIQRFCPAAMECDVASHYPALEAGKSWGKGREGPCVIAVKIGNKSTHALVDSGCGQTMIRTALVEGTSWQPHAQVAISCVHGKTKVYPTTKLYQGISDHQIICDCGMSDRPRSRGCRG
ncbi:UNVERIFIED_CONTAM: hypothetical protein FKN15_055727 [Acipenser sinensis]